MFVPSKVSMKAVTIMHKTMNFTKFAYQNCHSTKSCLEAGQMNTRASFADGEVQCHAIPVITIWELDFITARHLFKDDN